MKKQLQDEEYWMNLMIDDLTGHISLQDKNSLLQWIGSSEENRILFEEIRRTWELSMKGNDLPHFQQENGYARFRSRIRLKKPVASVSTMQRRRRHLLTLAAIVTPLLVISSLFTFYLGRINPSTVPDEMSSWSTLSVPKGSVSQIELPDGTSVWINAGSTLQYASSFGKTNRNVRLTGEAWFDVITNKELPLVVESGPVQVEVLGTKFNILAYEELSAIKVSLQEGAVCLHDPENISYLSPGEMGIYDLESGEMKITPCNPDLTKSWIERQLIFEGETFEEIIFRLEHHFNVHIAIENKEFLKRRFKGDFVKNETLEETLNVMLSGEEYTYRITGNEVRIYGSL